MPRNRLEMLDAIREAGHSLDNYADDDYVYAIQRHVHPDGRVEYSEGPVSPPRRRSPEPNRENPYGHGHRDGWHRGFGEGGRRGYPRGFHNGRLAGYADHSQLAYEAGHRQGWGAGDWRGMSDAFDDYTGNFDPRTGHPDRVYRYHVRDRPFPWEQGMGGGYDTWDEEDEDEHDGYGGGGGWYY
ncbi:hypothetical protein CC86DRAFT_410485 [Ophiobolus disseminans]|uniref:Uncharacterized protein n=1 Tax=Ophiobolus disseminans TaxID=1469910 RepID=A0A6A6ZM14_9PLEO|nr:hypothetical protein CC86DRAFT_410485 [Ophiobolus disseminans]